MTYLAPSDLADRPIAVVGGGTLGRRIALMLATRGAEVRIYDVLTDQRQAAVDFVSAELQAVLARRSDGTAGCAVAVDDLATAVGNTWLVVEAVPERPDLKRTVFGELDRIAPADAILASNSSSYPSSDLIDQVSAAGRARVVNTHYYLPPTRNAVEVMSCGATDQAVIDTLMGVLPTYGLIPFHVRKESVGFIFNRVWAAIKRESLEVVAEGVATLEEIDRIFMMTMGAPIGPFRMMDQVGLDVVLDIEEHYAALDPSLPIGPRALLREYVSEGRLGAKTGGGFYEDYARPGPRDS